MKVSRTISNLFANQIKLSVVFGAITIIIAAAVGVNTQSPEGFSGPSFSKTFLPNTIGPGSTSTLRFTISNDGPFPASDLAFSDTLPAGQVIADPSSASTTCGGGAILSAPDGGMTITLTNGTVAANSSCTVSVNVVGTSTAQNTSGSLTATVNGSPTNSGTATATLTVDTGRPGFSKSFSPDTIPPGGTSTLTFTIDNSLNASAESGLSFTDNLPTGLIIASPAGAASNCNTSSITANPGSSTISVFSISVSAGSTCTVSVNVTTNNTGEFNNVSGELTGFTPTTFSSGFATDTLNVPVNFLTKVFTDDPVAPGGAVTLKFTIQNPSRTSSATDIAFDDNLPAGLTFNQLVSNDCGGTLDTSTPSVLSFSGGTLAPEASCMITVLLNVPSGTSPGTYTNTTDAITATINGDTVTGNMASDQLTVSFAPMFTKQFLTNPVGAGGTTTLRFTITNTSSTNTLGDIAFSDVFDTIIPTASTVPTNPVCNGGTATFTPLTTDGSGNVANPAQLTVTGASLPAGASCTIDITLDVDTGAAAGTYPNMTSPITGTFTNNGMEMVEGRPAEDDLVVVGAPRLTKEFTDDPAQPGGTVTLQFTLTHDDFATADATNISFTDNLSDTLSGLTATLPPSPDPPCGAGSSLTGSMGDTLLTFSGATLMPGESCTFSVVLNVPGGASGGSYTNTTSNVTATVGGINVSGDPAEDDLRVAGVVLSKEFIDDPVIPGDTVTLRFTISNINPNDDATNIFFFDDLETAFSGLTAATPLPDPAPDCGAGATLTTSMGDTQLNFSGGSLVAGDSCTFDVTIQVPAGADDGQFVNATSEIFATLGGNGFVGDPTSDVLTVESDFLQLTKEFTNDPVAPGNTVDLKFTLTNLSSSAASMIAFSDNLSNALSGMTVSGLPISACGGTVSASNSDQTIDFTGGSLAASGSAGDSCMFTVTVNVPANAPPNSSTVNTTSNVSGEINGLAVNGSPASDILSISASDNSPPTIAYTPLENRTSTANPTISATVTDNVGVDRVSIIFSINGGAFSSNPCTLASGTVQNGMWNCTIPGTLTNPSAIAYFIAAEDAVPNQTQNPAPGIAAPNLFTIGAGAVPGGTYSFVSLANGASFSGNATILQNLTLGGIVNAGANTITLGCNAGVTGGGPSNYVIGTLAKQFCSPGMFMYPVGTPPGSPLKADNTSGVVNAPAQGFSSFNVNVTAVGSVPSTLSVTAMDAFLPNSNPDQSASRFWDVNETGDITADLSFIYLDEDVNGDENSYQVLRQETAFAEIYPGGTVNPATNTATAPNVTDFSGWAAGNLGPTSALVNIGGRVLTPSGRGIFRARLYLTDSNGNVTVRQTNPFGYFRFNDLSVGETYTLSVDHKSHTFSAPQLIRVTDENFGINIYANK